MDIENVVGEMFPLQTSKKGKERQRKAQEQPKKN